MRNLTLAISAIQRRAENSLYRCTSTVSALNYCSRIFFKTLSYLYEVVRTTSPPIFGLFAIFDRNFAKIVAPPIDGSEKDIVRLKEQSLPKKTIQTPSKSAYKRQRNACSNYAPLERTALPTRSVTKKNQKQKHRPVLDNAYRQDIVTCICRYTRVELITITNGKYTKYFPQLCSRIFTFWNISITHQRLLWRHLQADLRKVQCVTKCIWSFNKRRNQTPNRCIIGDGILPETATKLTKKRGSKFGALLWRHLTPKRKTAIQVHNYNPSRVQLLKKRFLKIYFLQDFWCAQTCSFRAVFGLLLRILTLAVSAMQRRAEKIYIGAHLRSRS